MAGTSSSSVGTSSSSVGTSTEDPGTCNADIKRYHELGLGRGINVTDPDMWRNKSSFLVRKVALDPEHAELNILVTDESNKIASYTKEVSSVRKQQQNIQLSLADPISQIKIGMDAYYSQSTHSSKIVSGKKCETKTISFKSGFHDVPLYASVDVVSLEVPSDINSPDSTFEHHLSCWILKRIRDRLIKNHQSTINVQEDLKDLDKIEPSPEAVEKLVGIISVLISKTGEERIEGEAVSTKKTKFQFRNIVDDCKEFLTNLGVTHYVSAIKLGAMEYNAVTVKKEAKTMGGRAEFEGNLMAKASMSGLFGRWFFFGEQKKQLIGRINEDSNTVDIPEGEAVIGIQIQPIDTLVRVQFVQVALRLAIKEYVQSKIDKIEGPFLISCKVGCDSVYWMVNDCHQLVGTTCIDYASMFYLEQGNDSSHPCDFFITYYGNADDAREILTNVSDPYVKIQRNEVPLPRYLVSNTNVLGVSSNPLEFKMGFTASRAQISLHARAQASFACFVCRTTPVGIQSWLEGEEFYLCCSEHSLKVNGFIAMQKCSNARQENLRGKDVSTHHSLDEQNGDNPAEGGGVEREEGGHDSGAKGENSTGTASDGLPEYRSVAVFSAKDPDSKDFGMLFRLHPKEFRQKYLTGAEMKVAFPSPTHRHIKPPILETHSSDQPMLMDEDEPPKLLPHTELPMLYRRFAPSLNWRDLERGGAGLGAAPNVRMAPSASEATRTVNTVRTFLNKN